jgi:hypothetical protein
MASLGRDTAQMRLSLHMVRLSLASQEGNRSMYHKAFANFVSGIAMAGPAAPRTSTRARPALERASIACRATLAATRSRTLVAHRRRRTSRSSLRTTAARRTGFRSSRRSTARPAKSDSRSTRTAAATAACTRSRRRSVGSWAFAASRTTARTTARSATSAGRHRTRDLHAQSQQDVLSFLRQL